MFVFIDCTLWMVTHWMRLQPQVFCHFSWWENSIPGPEGSVDPMISHVRPVEAGWKVPPSQCIHVQDRDWFVISRSVVFSLIWDDPN